MADLAKNEPAAEATPNVSDVDVVADPTKDEVGKAINGQQTVAETVANIVKLLNEQIA